MDDFGMPRAALVIRTGGFEGMRYDLRAPETLIGRNPDTDITLLDDGVSREHATLVYDATIQAFVIDDLQSTNGTRLNGKTVRSETLQHGDEIKLGSTVFVFELTV